MEHARFIVAQYDYIEHQYVRAHEKKEAVCRIYAALCFCGKKAFINTVKQLNLSEYQTAIRETRTSEIMKDVCASRSELGIIYLSKSMKLT